MTVRRTQLSIGQSPVGPQWHINGGITYPGAPAEGLLMNVRMVNAAFEDTNRPEFDAEANVSRFITRIPDYAASGIRAFTLCLQGGNPGYEGAVNSAFALDGSLRAGYMARVARVLDVCDAHGVAVILSCYYQRQAGRLEGADAIRAGIANAARWVVGQGYTHVVLEIANEYSHPGYRDSLLATPEGQIELLAVAREAAPGMLVAACKHDKWDRSVVPDSVGEATDVVTTHFNKTSLAEMPACIAQMRNFGKPVVINEDIKTGAEGAEAVAMCVFHHCSWGLMRRDVNQRYPFAFGGVDDDPVVYARLRALTTPAKAPPSRAATRPGNPMR